MSRVLPSIQGLLAGLAMMILWAPGGHAHCDALDGPVVTAAKKALESGDLNLTLIWVQHKDETAIREAFQKGQAVRKLSPEARDLADLYFFETLVRIHRAGEGAPHTGLKPAGLDQGPAIPAADMALASGSNAEVVKLLDDAIHSRLAERYGRALRLRSFPPDEVRAGREFIAAYVEYIHYLERLYEAAHASGERHDAEVGHHVEENP